MKSICGIVAEYNPLHNGHAYQMEEAQKRSQCDYLVVVMSGPFVQRGEPALLDKFTRARMAVQAGADLVIELPVVYAVSSAQGFAHGGMGLLHALGADAVSFGAETDDLPLLQKTAALLAHEPPELAKKIKAHLEEGHSHPQARTLAVTAWDAACGALLTRSNNVLALEYLQSLQRLESKMQVHAVLRRDGDYRGGHGMASATVLRQALAKGASIAQAVPPALHPLWQAIPANRLVFPQALDVPVRMALRRMEPEALDALPEAAEGLPRRLAKLAAQNTTYEALVAAGMTRRYSQARVQRTLIHALLGITQKDAQQVHTLPPYAHVLAMGLRGREALAEISRRSHLEWVTRPSTFRPQMEARRLWEVDLYANDLYATLSRQSWGQDFTEKLAPPQANEDPRVPG